MPTSVAWVPWSGLDYDKTFYDVLLPDGTVVKWCWPNAGKMNDVHTPGSTRSWGPDADIKVRMSPDHPLDAEYGGMPDA